MRIKTIFSVIQQGLHFHFLCFLQSAPENSGIGRRLLNSSLISLTNDFRSV